MPNLVGVTTDSDGLSRKSPTESHGNDIDDIYNGFFLKLADLFIRAIQADNQGGENATLNHERKNNRGSNMTSLFHFLQLGLGHFPP